MPGGDMPETTAHIVDALSSNPGSAEPTATASTTGPHQLAQALRRAGGVSWRRYRSESGQVRSIDPLIAPPAFDELVDS